jgi:hypothetical protein
MPLRSCVGRVDSYHFVELLTSDCGRCLLFHAGKETTAVESPPSSSSLDSFDRFNFFDLDFLSSADRVLKLQ